MSTEITTRKQAEKQLLELSKQWQTTFDAVADGILLLDSEQRILRSNKAMNEMFPEYRDGLMGRHCWEVIHGTNNPIPECPIRKMKNSRHRESTELNVKDRWFEVTVDPFFGADSQIAGAVHIIRDITERKLLLVALSDNESRLRHAEIVSKSGNWELHLDSKTMIGSEGAAKLFGLEKNQYDYETVKKIPLPECRAYLDSALLQLIERGMPYDVEYKIKNAATGEIIFIHSAAVYDKAKRIVFGTIRDISEHKRTEELLQESDTRFRDLFDDAPICYHELNQFGQIVNINRTELVLLGYSFEEMVGKFVWEFIAEGEVSRSAVLDKLSGNLQVGQHHERSYKKKDGTRVPVLVQDRLLRDENNGIIGLRTTMLDITERKKAEDELRKSEQFLQTVLDSISANVAIVDKNGVIISVNRAWRLFAQANSIDGASLCEGANYLHACNTAYGLNTEESFLFAAGIHSVLKGEQVEFTLEYSCHSLEEKRWFIGRVTRFSFANTLLLVISHENITSLKLESEALAKLNSEKDKFFSIIAHDLKSPFHPLIGLTEILATECHNMSSEEIEKYSNDLLTLVLNLYKLLENLLEWAQLHRGLTSFDKQETCLSDIFAECSVSLWSRAQQKGIILINEIPVKQLIFADKKILSSIIRNLLSNAVKFTGKNGVVTGSSRLIENNMVEVSVKDTGVGIPADIIDKLFEVGSKVTRRGTDGEPSTGLGLVLCKDFVEKHGGKIWVESEEGRGSTFFFTLPKS